MSPQRHRNRNPSIFASFKFMSDMLRAECKISGFRQNNVEAFAFLGRYAVWRPRRLRMLLHFYYEPLPVRTQLTGHTCLSELPTYKHF